MSPVRVPGFRVTGPDFLHSRVLVLFVEFVFHFYLLFVGFLRGVDWGNRSKRSRLRRKKRRRLLRM